MTRDELLRQMEDEAQVADLLGSHAPVSTVINRYLPLVKELDGLRPARRVWLVSIEEVAQMMDVKPRWLYDRKSTLPFIHKLGDGTLRASVPELEKWLDRNRTTRV